MTTTEDRWAPPVWAAAPAAALTGAGPDTAARPPRTRAWLASRLASGVLVLSIVYLAFVVYGAIGNRWYTVVEIGSGSMQPTIDAGDAILVTRPPTEIRRGMVLVLEVDGRVVTHRVVEVGPNGTFVTKGDANRAADDFSGAEVRIVGRYAGTLPFVGVLTRPR